MAPESLPLRHFAAKAKSLRNIGRNDPRPQEAGKYYSHFSRRTGGLVDTNFGGVCSGQTFVSRESGGFEVVSPPLRSPPATIILGKDQKIFLVHLSSDVLPNPQTDGLLSKFFYDT